MNIIAKECEDCLDLQTVYADLQCTLLDLTKNKYNSLVFGVKTPFSQEKYSLILAYMRIINARLYKCSYPCSTYSNNEILSRARLLVYKTDCSRCPECEEITTTTTTSYTPPECFTYLVEPYLEQQTGAPVEYPYSYVDCDGNAVIGMLTQYQVLNICALENSISVNPTIFSVTEYATGCNIVPEDCVCGLITNEETDPGVVPYVFSYDDCNGNTFTDVSLEEQDFMDICVRRSTLVTNFKYSLVNNGACIEDCPTTTTTATP